MHGFFLVLKCAIVFAHIAKAYTLRDIDKEPHAQTDRKWALLVHVVNNATPSDRHHGSLLCFARSPSLSLCDFLDDLIQRKDKPMHMPQQRKTIAATVIINFEQKTTTKLAINNERTIICHLICWKSNSFIGGRGCICSLFLSFFFFKAINLIFKRRRHLIG